MALTQKEIGVHLDLDQSQVSRMCSELSLDYGQMTLDEIRVIYIRRLREIAAGRAADGGLDLATERARLAREQADRIAMQNAQSRRDLAPVALMTEALARIGTRAAGILEAIPGQVRRRLPELPATEIQAIEMEITKARNLCAAITLEDQPAAYDPDQAPAQDAD